MTESRVAWMLSCLQDEYENLTEWEAGFVDSVTEWFEQHGSLSELQQDKLEQIYKERTNE